MLHCFAKHSLSDTAEYCWLPQCLFHRHQVQSLIRIPLIYMSVLPSQDQRLMNAVHLAECPSVNNGGISGMLESYFYGPHNRHLEILAEHLHAEMPFNDPITPRFVVVIPQLGLEAKLENTSQTRIPDFVVTMGWRDNHQQLHGRHLVICEVKRPQVELPETLLGLQWVEVCTQAEGQASHYFVNLPTHVARIVAIVAIGRHWRWGILALRQDITPPAQSPLLSEWLKREDLVHVEGGWSPAASIGTPESDAQFAALLEAILDTIPN